jgi:hypothetical protein
MARTAMTLTILVARSANVGLRRRRQSRSRDVSHDETMGLADEASAVDAIKQELLTDRAQLSWPRKGNARSSSL